MKILITTLFFIMPLVAFASEFMQATIIEKKDKTYIVESEGNTKIPIALASVSLKKPYNVEGEITVSNGSLSLIMWSRVEGNYFFSKIPTLQSISSTKPMHFSIPFNPLKGTVDQIMLEVILPNGGKVKIENLVIVESK